MRTKTLLCLAALTAAGVVSSMAQSNVYSLNVVGYYNRTIAPNKFALLANQFTTTNQSVASVLAGFPSGFIETWNGSALAINNWDSDFGWDDPNQQLGLGTGFFIKNTAATNVTVTFVGEVNQTRQTNHFTANVLKLTALGTPQAGDLETDFGFPVALNATGGAQLQTWNETTQSLQINNYDTDFGWDGAPLVIVGQGLFVKTTATKDWIRQFIVP